MTLRIHPYTGTDETQLFALLRSEGGEWSGYHSAAGAAKYKTALRTSIVYTGYEADVLCCFVRLRDDDGFGIYVYDLLVHKESRGKGYGRELLERARRDFPATEMYIMSDADAYYEKLGCRRAGSIFSFPFPQLRQ